MDSKLPQFLAEKRNELIWALTAQGYSFTDIGKMFGLNPSSVMRIVDKRPVGWTTKWRKVDES